MGKRFPISLGSIVVFATATIALFRIVRNYLKLTRPRPLETDAIVDVLKFLPRDEMDGLRLTSRVFDRVVRAYCSTKPLHLAEKIACYVGPSYPVETEDRPMHITKLAAELKRRQFRARHCVLYLRVISRVKDSEFFSQEYQPFNSENPGTNIEQIFWEIKKYLPDIASIWEHAKLEIVFDFFRFCDVDYERYFLINMTRVHGFEHVNHSALLMYILFGDTYGQKLGPLLEKCAKLQIREYGNHFFYAPFEELKALHLCRDVDFTGVLVLPDKLAEFLIADTFTGTRFLSVGLYHQTIRGTYRVMQTLLEEDFRQSKKPHSYCCRIRIQNNRRDQNFRNNLPVVRRLANETTGEYLSFEEVEMTPDNNWFRFVIVRCTREKWPAILV